MPGFNLFDEGYEPPVVNLTLKLKPNPHKIHDKQPALVGFVSVTAKQLAELGRIMEGDLVFLRVAIWDDTDRGGEQEYPVNGVIEYKEYTPKSLDAPAPTNTNTNTGEWF